MTPHSWSPFHFMPSTCGAPQSDATPVRVEQCGHLLRVRLHLYPHLLLLLPPQLLLRLLLPLPPPAALPGPKLGSPQGAQRVVCRAPGG